MTNRTKLLKLILAALFLAPAYVLPFFTGQIPEIGAMLCPMQRHSPSRYWYNFKYDTFHA